MEAIGIALGILALAVAVKTLVRKKRQKERRVKYVNGYRVK